MVVRATEDMDWSREGRAGRPTGCDVGSGLCAVCLPQGEVGADGGQSEGEEAGLCARLLGREVEEPERVEERLYTWGYVMSLKSAWEAGGGKRKIVFARRTSSLGVCDRATCAWASATSGAAWAERRSEIGTGSPRAASCVATSAATMLPKEWPKKANGRPLESVGCKAVIMASHSCSRLSHADSAWRGPRPGYWTAQTSTSAGSDVHSLNAAADPPACGKATRQTCGWSDGATVNSQFDELAMVCERRRCTHGASRLSQSNSDGLADAAAA